MTSDADDPVALVAELTLAEKVGLLTGANAWTTAPLERIGLREVVMSDGPAGVRGTDDVSVAISLPAPSALSATWDLDMVERVGALFAAEARSKGVDVVLAPVLNLQRTPVGGRHFECYSEDALLTARIGSQFVRAVQRWGVAACAKHYVANDSETERTSYVARVDESVLHEVYLAPFERAVREAGVWTVMAAYNGVDDGRESAPMTEHRGLVGGLLKETWAFDGLVMSDWAATRDGPAAARGGLDLVMPGPAGPWGDALLHAVQDGDVPHAEIDDKVVRLLRLARRVGKLGGAVSVPEPEVPGGGLALARELAARATVVLTRDADVWPLRPDRLREVALVGAGADEPYLQGGGSAKVRPSGEVTPLQGLRAALEPHGVIVRHARGGTTLEHAPPIDVARCVDPETGARGVRCRFLGTRGEVLGTALAARSEWTWFYDFPEGTDRVLLSTVVVLDEPGEHELELGAVGYHEGWLDGVLVASEHEDDGAHSVLDSAANDPVGVKQRVMVGHEARRVRVDLSLGVVDGGQWGRLVSGVLRHRAPGPSVDEEIAEAVALARRADVAVVVVGTNAESESEGWDRPSLDMPGRQDELVRRVASVNPRTVVVVHAGAPVVLPWLDGVGTVLWGWLAGQEAGNALADVLLGVVEPAGRLPWTLPTAGSDAPVPDAIPVRGVLDYAEGDHVGYVGWQAAGRAPALPFGHGLGWGSWVYGTPTVTVDPHRVAAQALGDVAVRCTVSLTNTSDREAREVLQVFVARPGEDLRRLAGFTVAVVPAAGSVDVTIELEARTFGRWEGDGTPAGRWLPQWGAYAVWVGRSAADLRGRCTVRVNPD